MHGTYEPWTQEQLDAIGPLTNAGLTIKQIAAKIGRTYHSVITRRHRAAKGFEYIMRRRWTVEDNQKLAELWVSGASQTQIAKEMGVTPGSIAGRISRMGLRERTPERPKKERKGRAPRVSRPWAERKKYYQNRSKPVLQMAPEPDALRLSLADLPNSGCRYIVTDDHPMLYCGHVRADGSSYCAHHTAIVWRPAPARERNARPR